MAHDQQGEFDFQSQQEQIVVDCVKSGNEDDNDHNFTLQQLKFSEEYLQDLNVYDAAKRSGIKFSDADGAYYTYFLVHPVTCGIFYVGKGKGKRVTDHVKNAKKGLVDNAEKFRVITEIHNGGMSVVELIFSNHDEEVDAYMVERNLIRKFRKHGLTNISGGMMSNAELAVQQAKAAIARMLPFEIWLKVATRGQLEAAFRIGKGDLRACYDGIIEEFDYIASKRYKNTVAAASV